MSYINSLPLDTCLRGQDFATSQVSDPGPFSPRILIATSVRLLFMSGMFIFVCYTYLIYKGEFNFQHYIVHNYRTVLANEEKT